MRRPRVPWMTQGDDRILETLASSGLTLSPRIISFNTEYSRNYVSKRLSKLCEAGLTVRIDEGLYEIAELGALYLKGEVDPEDLVLNS